MISVKQISPNETESALKDIVCIQNAATEKGERKTQERDARQEEPEEEI